MNCLFPCTAVLPNQMNFDFIFKIIIKFLEILLLLFGNVGSIFQNVEIEISQFGLNDVLQPSSFIIKKQQFHSWWFLANLFVYIPTMAIVRWPSLSNGLLNEPNPNFHPRVACVHPRYKYVCVIITGCM
jgi:hypothetical protein